MGFAGAQPNLPEQDSKAHHLWLDLHLLTMAVLSSVYSAVLSSVYSMRAITLR